MVHYVSIKKRRLKKLIYIKEKAALFRTALSSQKTKNHHSF
jgi:hypothetical protein